jgi:hypothetical protein
MRKIAVGDLGEFWYGDYKEPFVQLEGAVSGHPQGVLLKADDGKLLCAYCGKIYDNLGNHARLTHGLPASEYKKEVGLLQKSALVSEVGRQRSIRTALRSRSEGKLRQRVSPSNYDYQKQAKGDKSPMRVPEFDNKTGRCYAQVLTVSRQIAHKQRTVTFAALARHGIGKKTVRRYFGDLKGLRDAMGVDVARSSRRYTDRQLLDVLRNTARDLGRTPTESDLRRLGLPSKSTYHTRFGTLATAVGKAGLPPAGHAQFSNDEYVMALRLYALLGSSTAVAERMGRSQRGVTLILERLGIPRAGQGRRPHIAARTWAAELAERIASPVEAVA